MATGSSMKTDTSTMQSVGAELDTLAAAIGKDLNAVEAVFADLQKIWLGEAAGGYIKKYHEHSPEIKKMTKVMQGCSETLLKNKDTYNKAVTDIGDIIRQNIGKQ